MRQGDGAHDAPRSRLARLVLALGVAALVLSVALPSAAQRRTRIVIDPDALQAEAGPIRSGAVVPVTGSEWERLRAMVGQWRRDIEAGNSVQADDLLPRMQQLLSVPSPKSRPLLVGSLTAMGHDWMLVDNWDHAERAFKAGVYLEPQFWPSHLGQAELALRRDKDPIGTLGGVIVAARASLSKLPGQLRALSRVGLVLIVATMIAVGGYSLVLLVKYNRLLRHGVRERLADRVPEGIDGVLAWLLVFLPVVLFLSPEWWVVYWLVVFGGYGRRAERWLCAAALLLVGLLPAGFHAVAWTSSLLQDPTVRALTTVSQDAVTLRTIRRFEEVVERLDRHPDALFLLARMNSRAGNDDEALALYQEIVETEPGHARVIVNRGNIHFRRGDPRRAIVDYKQATDLDPAMALAWRNGNIAYNQELETETATEWMRQAQAIDPEAVSEWRAVAGPYAMVDARLTSAELRGLVMQSHGPLTAGLVPTLLAPVSIVAVLGLLFMLTRLRRPGGILEASACEKCGRAFCSRCHATARTSAYCTQCIHLYVKKDGVSPEVRTAKLAEVEKWVAVNSIAIRLFNIVLPGAGGLYANRIVSGTVLLYVWSAAISALLLPAYVLMARHRVGHVDLSLLFGLELAVLLGTYLVALLQSLRH